MLVWQTFINRRVRVFFFHKETSIAIRFPKAKHVVFLVPFFRQVTKNDLEQRHPQLEDIFTLAQNIKNKTSNLDVRTSITEKRKQFKTRPLL